MILVDPLFKTAKPWGRGQTLACHMISDTDEEEMHLFAERLGLRREWVHRDHYDLSPEGREMALALGAEEVSVRVISRIIRARRRGYEAGGQGSPGNRQRVLTLLGREPSSGTSTQSCPTSE